MFFQSNGNLPTDVWLPVHMTFARFNGGDMECATGAAFKSGRVVKDAGAIHNARLLFAVLLGHEPALVLGLVLVLPVTAFETLHIFSDILEIFFIEEMRSE